MRTWADVATLATAKNLDGRLVARSAPGLPFLLEEGMEVAFVPPVLDMPRRARVVSVRPQGADAGVVVLSGVDNPDIAHALVGCHCLVRRAELPELARAAAAARDEEGLGWEVHDAVAGFVGTLCGVEELPGQSLLVVKRTGEDADAAPLLVPLVDEIVLAVDDEAGRVDVDLPQGLLDL